jgi:lysine 2,3-aminomutase
MSDPLAEEKHSPVPGLTHRYPDRVLFLVSNQCAVYCRFCNRKRKVGRRGIVTQETIKEGIAYIKAHRQVRDVLLSGGDPLLLDTDELAQILAQLRQTPHVEIIRIGTRVPCTLPQRITPRLVKMISKFHPVFINTHFNHPREITPDSARACAMLADAGIPLGCQTVLLKGVNDDKEAIRLLMQGLIKIRVRPYYLFQCDQALGTSHFWTHPQKGVDIIASLVGQTSGLCVPHFCIDLPGGGGKILHMPTYVEAQEDNALVVKNFEGKTIRYPIYK